MKDLQEFRNLVEEEKSDYTKFDMLVRAGLANKAQLARIHRILDDGSFQCKRRKSKSQRRRFCH